MSRTVRIRSNLLKAVRNEVNARLEQSLHKAVRIHLLKETEPEQVQRIWDIEVKIGKRPSFQLPPDRSITEVFAQTGGKFMILGAPGAGKTTTLLEVARELISRAEAEIDRPIPILFDLSTWQEGKLSIACWLSAEINSRYGIRKNIIKKLINEQQILPLLDGLDELELARQDIVIQEINQLLEIEKPPKHIVICTHLEDYKNCQNKVRVYGAIYLRPLSNDRIREYLLNSRSRELWENIKEEPQLLELARSPLLLNMMALAYEEILIHAWKRIESKPDRCEYLLNAYVRRMLTQNIKSKFYRQGKEPRPEKTRYWLVWLAKNMSQLNRKEVIVEKINRNWLQTRSQKRWYQIGLWLTLGGIAGIKKFILRLLLWRNGYIPWNYDRFLGLATERLFLQPINGGYRFVHELLQRHLAEMDKIN